MSINEKLKGELVKMLQQTNPEDTRTRDDILGFDENIYSLLNTMKADQRFDTYDLIPNTEIHKIDIGEIKPESEWDFFDSIRVSNQFPFVVMNLNSNKVNVKGKYFANDRRFKIYHSSDINTPHTKYLKHWLDSEDMNVPFTIKMKVMLKPPKILSQSNENDELNENIFDDNLFNSHYIRDKSLYIDVIFRFDDSEEKGLYIKFEKNFSDDSVDSVIEILQSHITGFNFKFKKLSSIIATFVIDKILIEPRLFRQILTGNYNKLKRDPVTGNPIRAERSLRPWTVLWTNENLKGLALRKHFILNFKLGDIEAKITISRNKVKNNDLFSYNDASVKFKKDAEYELIKISNVATMEDALLVKEIVSAMFYLYGEPIPQFIGVDAAGQPIYEATTRSVKWANVFNRLLSSQIYFGATFGPSQRVTALDLQATSKVIQKLRQIDPTFYGSIPTGKPVARGKKQPIPIVSSSDPNWYSILQAALVETYGDLQRGLESQRQIIRYPFELVDEEGETIGETPITVIPPYFLICTEDAPNFQIKPNNINPMGGKGTFHPYLIACSGKKFVETPGTDFNTKFQALISGLIPIQGIVQEPAAPFPLTELNSNSSNTRNNYRRTTYKILNKEDQEGNIPTSLERIFNEAYSNIKRQVNISQNLEAELQLTFRRIASPREPESILHILCMYGGRPEIMEYYNSIPSKELKNRYLKEELKYLINRETNWNLARQEFFDMDSSQISEYFMQKDIFIDPKLFKYVLEQFFKVYILCIRFDGIKCFVDIPRHKYLHISKSSYDRGTIPLVIFKHETTTSARNNFPHCEIVMMSSNQTGKIPHDLNILQTIFNLANKTLDLSFIDVHHLKEDIYLTAPMVKNNANLKPGLDEIFPINNLLYQFIDGAGKTRAVLCKFNSDAYGDSEITVICEPMRPINLPSFNDPKVVQSGRNPNLFFVPEDFEAALAFVNSLGIKLEDISYKLYNEDLLDIDERQKPIEKPKSIRTNLLNKELDKAKGIQKALSSAQKGVQGQFRETMIELSGKGKEEEELEREALITGEIKASDMLNAMKREAISDEASTEKSKHQVLEGVPLAIGIWFKIKDVQFYISTEPGEIPTTEYAENDIPYFEVEPDQTFFWQHDYFERVMNIMVQLIRNLYIYSKLDDPEYFIQRMVTIDPNNEYRIIGIQRRLDPTKNFNEAMISYANQYSTFFKKIDGVYTMIIDSEKTKDALLQHLKQVQKLKLDIFGASGSLYLTSELNNEGRIAPLVGSEGQKVIKYIPHVEGANMINISSVPKRPFYVVANEQAYNLTSYMIENIERMDQFFNRPDYIEQVFIYPSDFTVRGPDQQVFISEEDIRDYIDFLDFEKVPTILSIPLPKDIDLVKTPQYVLTSDKSLYIIQNVLGGNIRRAVNIMVNWDRERINLGFYADEWEGNIPDPSSIPYLNVLFEREGYTSKEFHTDNKYALLRYSSNKYAAVMQITRRGKSLEISIPDPYR